MTTINFKQSTIGQIVADDFRTAGIFKNAGIDFCCGGKKDLQTACDEKGVKLDEILDELEKTTSAPALASQDFNRWNLTFLSDYIVNTHHRYVLETLPELVAYTQKIASVHGSNHPELTEVAELFRQIDTELREHLKKEEEVLFPAIREALLNGNASAAEIIESEITRMWGEHEFAGGAMDKIHEITNGYELPEDACNTYRVTFSLLNQFENDLHVHVHLENNILFPKAMQLGENFKKP